MLSMVWEFVINCHAISWNLEDLQMVMLSMVWELVMQLSCHLACMWCQEGTFAVLSGVLSLDSVFILPESAQ